MIKYCFLSTHPAKLLQEANEIFVEYKNRDEIPNLAKKYPYTNFILDIPYGERIDIDQLIGWNEICFTNFCVQINDITQIQELRDNKIKFYLSYVVRSFYELHAIEDSGACNAIIEAPVFFSWEQVSNSPLSLRLKPHKANSGVLTYKDGVCGSWIRPEDLWWYNPCIVDFSDASSEEAEALYEIYHNTQEWNSDLNLIVSDLNYSANNKLIDSKSLKHRLSCGQMCQQTGKCRICYNVLALAQRQQLKDYIKDKTIKINE